jgi:hypothetical protein
MKEVGKQIAKLIDLKSIATLLMTGTMIALMFYREEINKELLMLFSTTYGSMMTYYYNRKEGGGNNE